MSLLILFSRCVWSTKLNLFIHPIFKNKASCFVFKLLYSYYTVYYTQYTIVTAKCDGGVGRTKERARGGGKRCIRAGPGITVGPAVDGSRSKGCRTGQPKVKREQKRGCSTGPGKTAGGGLVVRTVDTGNGVGLGTSGSTAWAHSR